MSKRISSSAYDSHKRLKLDNNVPTVSKTNNESPRDDIWGEDFNEDEIEECIFQASQACSQLMAQNSTKNDKPLCQYSQFGNPLGNSTLLSTTHHNFAVPSTSKAEPFSSSRQTVVQPAKPERIYRPNLSSFDISQSSNGTDNLVYKDDDETKESNLIKEVKKLKFEKTKIWAKYESKEGEVAILRNQLKQVQKEVDTMRMDKFKLMENERQVWLEKISGVNKELNSTKSKLDLKDLEVFNLKSQCKVLASTEDLHSKLATTLKKSPRKQVTSTVLCQTETKIQKIFQEAVTFYPLKNCLQGIFNQSETDRNEYSHEKPHQIVYNDNISADPKDEDTQERAAAENPPEMYFQTSKMENDEPLKIKYIFRDVSNLYTFSNTELNSDKARFIINKLVYVCEELLANTGTALKNLRKVPTWKILEFSNESFCVENIPNKEALLDARPLLESENAIVARQIVAVLAAVVKCSAYLAEYILGESPLKVEDDNYIKTHSQHFLCRKQYMENLKNHKFTFLNLILSVTTIIVEYKRMNYCSGLLMAITELLGNCSSKITLKNEGKKCIFETIKLITFSRPPFAVLCSITKVLRNYSYDEEFIKFLCRKPNRKYFKRERHLLKFTREACFLQVFTSQLSTYLHQSKTDLSVSIRQVQLLTVFLYNYVNEFRMEHLKNPTECECSISFISCYTKIINVSLRFYTKNQYNYLASTQLAYIKTTYERVISLLVLLTYHKELEMRQQSVLHRYNLTILDELTTKLAFKEEYRNSLEEMITTTNNQVKFDPSDDEELETEDVKIEEKIQVFNQVLNNSFQNMLHFD